MVRSLCCEGRSASAAVATTATPARERGIMVRIIGWVRVAGWGTLRAFLIAITRGTRSCRDLRDGDSSGCRARFRRTGAHRALAAGSGPPAPDTGNLRVEKDIVFGKGGHKDLTLDVYRPPAGVTSKRTAIVHLFGGGFFVGNKNAGYIINDIKALGARGYTSVSANYRLQQESLWPAQIHDTKAAIRWTRANAERIGVDANRIVVAGYSAGGMLSLMAAGTNGRKEFEGNGGNAGVSSDVNASIGVYPLASAQIATGLSRRGRQRPRTSRPHHRRPTSPRASRRRSSFTARTTARCRCSRASTSGRSSMPWASRLR